MRLPWISRSHYDDVVAMQAQMIDLLRAELTNTSARLHMLRVQGHAEPLAPLPAPPPSLPDPVSLAIQRRSNGDRALASFLRAQAAADKAKGMSPDEIAAAIDRGTQPLDELEASA